MVINQIVGSVMTICIRPTRTVYHSFFIWTGIRFNGCISYLFLTFKKPEYVIINCIWYIYIYLAWYGHTILKTVIKVLKFAGKMGHIQIISL